MLVHDMNFLKNEHGCERNLQDDFPENWVGRWANRSFRMRTMTVSESSPTNSPRRVVHTSVVYFQEEQVLF